MLTTSLPCCRPWNLSFSFGRALQVGQPSAIVASCCGDVPLLAAVLVSAHPASCLAEARAECYAETLGSRAGECSEGMGGQG